METGIGTWVVCRGCAVAMIGAGAGGVVDWTKVRGAVAILGAMTEGIVTWTMLSGGAEAWTEVVAGVVVVWTRLVVTFICPGIDVALGV